MMHPIPDAALDADIAILGKKGRGKSYVARGLVKRLLALGRRVLVLDPLSSWWGLRVAADGTAPGFSIAVFGGPHGDLAINEHAGRALARVIATENLPSVIDLGAMRKGEQARFVGDLLDELFARNRAPLTIVFEEADAFAPQQPMNDDSMRVLGEVDRIARRGRAYGFRLISISQRAAKLHKDVLTQLSVLVALGVTSPQDRDAIKAWVEGNADRDRARDVYGSLAALKVGEGWVWAPDFDILDRVPFPRNRTLDTSATPQHGAGPIAPKMLAEVDVGAVRAALAEAQEQAAQDDPKALRAKLADTHRELAAIQARAPDLAALRREVEIARRAAWLDGHRAGWDQAMRDVRPALDATLDGMARAVAAPPSIPAHDDAPPRRQESTTAATAFVPLPGNRSIAVNGRAPGDLPRVQRAFLMVLAQRANRTLTRNQVAIFAGYSSKSRHVDNTLTALRSAGCIEGGRDGIRITAAGRNVVEPFEPLPTGKALRELWLGQLAKAEASFLRILLSIYPQSVTRNELAERAGYSPKSRHVDNTLARLRTYELATHGRQIRARDELFEEAS